MLLCDECDKGYHLECLNPVLDDIPIGVWYCIECIQESDNNESNEDDEDEEVVFNLPEMAISTRNIVLTRTRGSTETTTASSYRQIARTRFSERIRRRINNNRLERGASIVISESEEEDDNISENEIQDLIKLNQPTTSSSVVKKPVKRKRRRRRCYKRKTRRRTTTGTKKPYKKKRRKRLVKRRKRRVGSVKKTDTQRRIANVLKSYQSLPKVIEERLDEKKRIDSGMRVFKPFQPTLESEFNEFEEPCNSSK